MSWKHSLANRDHNEKEIIEDLRRIGKKLHGPDKVCVVHMDYPCDILVGFDGYTFFLEVKGKKSPYRLSRAEVGEGGRYEGMDRRLTKSQAEFCLSWAGDRVYVVDSVDSARLATMRCASCGYRTTRMRGRPCMACMVQVLPTTR